jgi:hypothetical protein
MIVELPMVIGAQRNQVGEIIHLSNGGRIWEISYSLTVSNFNMNCVTADAANKR